MRKLALANSSKGRAVALSFSTFRLTGEINRARIPVGTDRKPHTLTCADEMRQLLLSNNAGRAMTYSKFQSC